MIKGIGLENFKAFKNLAYLDFKKINVFLGPNSSGKSSYLKGLLALKNTMTNQDSEPALHLSERLGDFTSLVFGNRVDEKITITIRFDTNYHEPAKSTPEQSSEGFKYGSAALLTILILFTLFSKKDQKGATDFITQKEAEFVAKELERVEFSVFQEAPKTPNRLEVLKVFFKDGDVYEVKPYEKPHQIFLNGKPVTHHQIVKPYKFLIQFQELNLIGSDEEDWEIINPLAIAVSFIEQELKNLVENMIHIEPFRNEPKRSEIVTNFQFDTVGSKGENMLTSLIGLKNARVEGSLENNSLQDDINRWMNEFQLAQTVEVEELGSNNFALKIKNKKTGVTSNIVDVGAGTSQLLPIIVESVISAPHSVLLIEEPETHIHPNAQAKLGELFVECSQKYDKRFFIETHSMYLVMQLQIMAAKKLLKPEDVGIYYFRQDENGTHVIDLKLNENGQFDEEFPTGFFDVAYELTKTLLSHM
ncbi:DUF3696 domain-containing protein [Tumebacillus algifaecis]|nr:DUF3696 domain-containing protein [Tumebacillus algifaecis]